MENELSPFNQILKLLHEKAPLKIDVYQMTEKVFNILKDTLRSLESELKKEMGKVDPRVEIKYTQRGPFDLEFRVSDDVLIFCMHTDAYTFHESHPVWKNSYVSSNINNAYCGIIAVYNFLTDSIKFNRGNDMGVLIGRILINREQHFFADGKRHLGILFNDFENAVADEIQMKKFVETAILYSLNFDIFTPPFDQVKMISVEDLKEKNVASIISTGKRLGFKFQSDSEPIE